MNHTLTALTARLDDLETKLAFQDDTIDALEQLVRAQNTELQTMQRYLRLIAEKVAPLDNSEPGEQFNPANERPPHY